MGVSNVKVAMELLTEVPQTLRKLVAENAKLASDLASYREREIAEDIVSELDRKGLGDSDIPFQEKVAQLIASGKDLPLLKEAVNLATPNLSFASVSDEDGGSADPFEDYILGS